MKKIIVEVDKHSCPSVTATGDIFYNHVDNFLYKLNKRIKFNIEVYPCNKIAPGYRKLTYDGTHYVTSKGQKLLLCSSGVEKHFGKLPKVISFKVLPAKKKKDVQNSNKKRAKTGKANS